MNKEGKILDRTVKRKAKLGLSILLAVLFLSVMALPVLAANGDGGGGGGGGDSKDEPLILVSANPADGQQDVSLKVKIQLSFNKNVVNMSVKDNNQKCFTLYSANNNVVPVNVVIADDQMEPEKKRDIVLIPLQELQPAATYTVKVAPELKSKNGDTLGKQLAISFVTAGPAQPNSSKQPAQVAETKSQVAETTPQVAETKPQVNTSSSSATAKTTITTNGEKSNQAIKSSQAKPNSAAVQTDPASKDNTIKDNTSSKVKERSPVQSQSSNESKKSDLGINWGIIVVSGLALAAVFGYIYIKRRT